MKGRGKKWLDWASEIKKLTPTKPAKGLSQPPKNTRPKKLSVTEIKTLIRDPCYLCKTYLKIETS